MSIEWSFDSGLNTETEPNAEIESPCLLNTLRRDLDKLLNRSGVRSPISTLRAKEKHTVLQKIKEILQNWPKFCISLKKLCKNFQKLEEIFVKICEKIMKFLQKFCIN